MVVGGSDPESWRGRWISDHERMQLGLNGAEEWSELSLAISHRLFRVASVDKASELVSELQLQVTLAS